MTDSQRARQERILASPQFVKGRFRNPTGANANIHPGEMGPVLKDFVLGGKHRRPPQGLPGEDPRAVWSRSAEGGFRVTWLGHSTLFLEIGGLRVLTDPVWDNRVSPVSFAGPRRFQPMVVPIDGMPEVDVILISHDHYDHLDKHSVVEFARRTKARFVTSLGVGAHLERWGIASDRVDELDWWESVEVEGVKFTATPAQHFSGRGLGDRNSTLWSSFVLESDRNRFFFGADSGLGPHFEEIGRRMGRFDVVTLEIGAFHTAWADIHMGPDNAWKAREMLGSGAFLPIHWGTFDLAIHGWEEPAEGVLAAAAGRELWMPRMGHPLDLERRGEALPWWREILV